MSLELQSFHTVIHDDHLLYFLIFIRFLLVINNRGQVWFLLGSSALHFGTFLSNVEGLELGLSFKPISFINDPVYDN